LDKKRNDILTWALMVSLLGFCFVVAGGWYYKDLIIRKFGQNSPQLVQYYFWIFPFGLGLTLYTILESYAWQLKKSVLTNFLREIQFRIFATLLIVLSLAGWIASFDTFIKIYAFTYIAIALILLVYMLAKGYIHLTFKISIVTKKFYKKILTLISFVFGGTLVYAISLIFDSIVIASVLPEGLAGVAVYSLAQNIASLIQAPQRGIISSSIAALSRAWKDKDLKKIAHIYRQSSINQLIFACGMFCLIWLNFSDGIFTFKLQSGYLDAKWVFFFIGLYRIIDMGTGVNAQIISTSTLWKFEFLTGTILLLLTLPLTYILTKYYLGILGPPVASLFSFCVYNGIRYWFLLKKFKLQPFTIKTLYTVLLAVIAFSITYLLFHTQQGFWWIMLRSSCFVLIYGAGTIALNLSHDIKPVWNTLRKKLGFPVQP
ncbi:MAG: lipopolysaccharide biosynthesis protein, partial [Ferruginibacter sp.]